MIEIGILGVLILLVAVFAWYRTSKGVETPDWSDSLTIADTDVLDYDRAVDFIFSSGAPKTLDAYKSFLVVSSDKLHMGISRRIVVGESGKFKLADSTGKFNAIATKLKRNSDDVEFVLVYANFENDLPVDDKSYALIVSFATELQKKFDKARLMIVGKFNTHSPKEAFHSVLGDKYNYCFTTKAYTDRASTSFISSTGIIVNKEIYPSINFRVDLNARESDESLLFNAKLYRSKQIKPVIDSTEDAIIAMAKKYKKAASKVDAAYDMDPKFDSAKSPADEKAFTTTDL